MIQLKTKKLWQLHALRVHRAICSGSRISVFASATAAPAARLSCWTRRCQCRWPTPGRGNRRSNRVRFTSSRYRIFHRRFAQHAENRCRGARHRDCTGPDAANRLLVDGRSQFRRSCGLYIWQARRNIHRPTPRFKCQRWAVQPDVSLVPRRTIDTYGSGDRWRNCAEQFFKALDLRNRSWMVGCVSRTWQ